jgi:hypothetical protein
LYLFLSLNEMTCSSPVSYKKKMWSFALFEASVFAFCDLVHWVAVWCLGVVHFVLIFLMKWQHLSCIVREKKITAH